MYNMLNRKNMKKNITIIGNSVIDVLSAPVKPELLRTSSCPAKEIKLSFGGDALNESVILSRFGREVQLISRIGQDEAGARIQSFLKDNGISRESMIVEQGIDTSINIVLIDEQGERHFITNPLGSQRRLSKKDIMPYVETMSDIVSFASIFVSSELNVEAMTELFRAIKEKPGRILAADMTKPKNGEKLENLRELLSYVDYILPNEEEIALLTSEDDPLRNAELLIEAGVSCAVIKCGKRGCLIRTKDELYRIPAYEVEHCVDTTGAGDCFAAGFLWALSEGYPLSECGRFACAAASCAVECVGATDGVASLNEPMKRYKTE